MTVGDRIKKQRELLGISQSDFAASIGVLKQTLYKYENNVITNVPSDKIELAAQKLGINPSDLMGWEKPKMTDAELLADIAGDPKMIEYIKKINDLGTEDKEKIYSYIDYVVSTKK